MYCYTMSMALYKIILVLMLQFYMIGRLAFCRLSPLSATLIELIGRVQKVRPRQFKKTKTFEKQSAVFRSHEIEN